jgi:hypothetical protein
VIANYSLPPAQLIFVPSKITIYAIKFSLISSHRGEQSAIPAFGTFLASNRISKSRYLPTVEKVTVDTHILDRPLNVNHGIIQNLD